MSTRRLAAILAADVAGFGTMMERDEEGTAAPALVDVARGRAATARKPMSGVATTRRAFIALLGSAAAPIPAFAQRTKVPVIGVLWHAGSAEQEKSYRTPFLEGLARLGYGAGNMVLEERYADEKPVRFAELAAELAQLNPDIIVAVSPLSAVAVKRATTTIPTVFIAVPDPVGLKLVDSLARPGGNVTGLSTFGFELWTKRVQLLREAFPRMSRLAFLSGETHEYERRGIAETRAAAERLGMKFEHLTANTANGLEGAVSRAGQGRADALLVGGTPVFFLEKKRIAELAVANRVPTMGATDLFAEDGVLMSYGASFPAIFRRAGWFVAKILNGTGPNDLPVEHPTFRYDLIVNLNTARLLNIELPPALLNLADRIIE